MRVLTIGHSIHSIERFVDLLRKYDVTAIADVRSNPFSRRAPQFNREPLKNALQTHGVEYAFLGRELGARSNDPACYVDGRVQYGRLAETDDFREGMDRLLTGMSTQRIALMCAEKEPLDCHRALLVANRLTDKGVGVDHILADGSVESHQDMILRLLDYLDMQPSLLQSTDELIVEALAKQEERIAYVDPRLVAPSNRSR
jgi:uncharacterized protein (DUF488 family)